MIRATSPEQLGGASRAGGNRELIMLVDYKGLFYMSVREPGAGMNLEELGRYFAELGWKLIVKRYPEVDVRGNNYAARFVMYQSAEDRDLFYKSYIEDVLLALDLQGAVLIPEFHLFRAHHNKLFMELLRDLSPLDDVKNIVSKGYGTYEDLLAEHSRHPNELVIKPAEGWGSRGVRMLRGARAQLAYAKRVSRSFHAVEVVKDVIRTVRWPTYGRSSDHRRKFIVQNYIRGIDHDYKVLVFGTKYYVLLRRNRRGDFRASGSGMFEYRHDLPTGLLDFAERVFNSFTAPFISLDVGFNGRDYVLFEFQFVHIGTYTLERSPFHFVRDGQRWKTVAGTSNLEQEVAASVARYCERLLATGC